MENSRKLLELIKQKIEESLHLANGTNRRKIHERIPQSKLIEILSSMWNKLENIQLQSKQTSKEKKQLSCLIYTWLLDPCNGVRQFLNYLLPFLETNDSKDALHLITFYGQVVMRKFLSNATNNQSVVNNLTMTTTESNRGLLQLGGGTIGEIWNVNKKRCTKRNLNLSSSQRQTSSLLYDLSLKFRRTAEEKENIPPCLKSIDNGGMFFPKDCFLPLISKINDCVVAAWVSKPIEKCTIQDIMKAVELNRSPYYEEFISLCRKELNFTVQDDSQIGTFFSTWFKKIVHARIQECISSKLEVEQCQSTRKGGNMLRDELSSFRKNKPKSKSCASKPTINITTAIKKRQNKSNKSKPSMPAPVSVKKKQVLQEKFKCAVATSTRSRRVVTKKFDCNFIYD